MESNSYDEILNNNNSIYTEYAEEYFERTKNGHKNYLSNFINKFVTQIKGNILYDLGCGPGRDLAFFSSKGFKAVGVDSSIGMINLCKKQGLEVIHNDFIGINFEPNSVDAFWAYTSHTIINKEIFYKLLEKYSKALKPNTGILGLGMIEGTFEGWKQDNKYEGKKRFVARYTYEELRQILLKFFGTVEIEQLIVDNKTYLHCLCKNTPIATVSSTSEAAKELFNNHCETYYKSTQSGISLLEEDRDTFSKLLLKEFKKASILDIGCGPGRDIEIFSKNPKLFPQGIDISRANVDICVQRGLKAQEGDIYNINKYFQPNSFHGIWCNCSVTNWIIKEKLPQILQDIKKLLVKNGYIFIGSVLGEFTGWEIDNKYGGLPRYNNHWREEELRNILASLGVCVFERKLMNTGKKNYIDFIFKNE